MIKILFIDCSGSPQYDPKVHIKPFLEHYPHDFVSPEFEELPGSLASYSHLVYSGSMVTSYESEWQSRLYNFVRSSYDYNIPTLGICYGHQIIAREILGYEKLRQKPKEDHGWEKVTVIDDDPLLGKKGSIWFPFVTHGYELFDLPSDKVKVIASSDNCITMAYKFLNKPVWGFQCHFEISPLQAKDFLNDYNLQLTCNSLGFEYSDKTYSNHQEIFKKFFESHWN
jgi:GMP synthase (glutamine-hydrolysing)